MKRKESEAGAPGLVELSRIVLGFGQKLAGANTDLLACASIVWDAIQAHGRDVAMAAFRREYATISPDLWIRFERVGAGIWHRDVLLMPCTAADRVSKLSKEDQAKIFEEGFDVLDNDGVTIRKVPVSRTTSKILRQVLVRKHLRSIPEQRGWQELRKTPRAGSHIPLGIYVQGGLLAIEPSSRREADHQVMLIQLGAMKLNMEGICCTMS